MKGYCKKHGEVATWIVCRHIKMGKARNINLETSNTALCFFCTPRLYDLDIDDLASVCEKCLKNFIRKLIEHNGVEKDIKEIVVGLEHLDMKIIHLDPDNPLLV